MRDNGQSQNSQDTQTAPVTLFDVANARANMGYISAYYNDWNPVIENTDYVTLGKMFRAFVIYARTGVDLFENDTLDSYDYYQMWEVLKHSADAQVRHYIESRRLKEQAVKKRWEMHTQQKGE